MRTVNCSANIPVRISQHRIVRKKKKLTNNFNSTFPRDKKWEKKRARGGHQINS